MRTGSNIGNRIVPDFISSYKYIFSDILFYARIYAVSFTKYQTTTPNKIQ
jgi:hypothetical protein